jgi:hypothetical protein
MPPLTGLFGCRFSAIDPQNSVCYRRPAASVRGQGRDCLKNTEKPPWLDGGFSELKRSYFCAVAGSFFAYLRRKRSMRPAVSINFCLPVKNG